jgi:hypothetical protein
MSISTITVKNRKPEYRVTTAFDGRAFKPPNAPSRTVIYDLFGIGT